MDNPFDALFNELSLIKELLAQTSPGANSSPQETYLKLSKAADFTGFTENALRVMVSKGQIPYIKKQGKLFFRQSDLVEWFESGSVQARQLEAEDILLLNKKRL